MGTQHQTPDSQTQQPGTRQPASSDEQRKSERTAKTKDAGNVPRSDDDVVSEGDQGTREDGSGGKVRNS